MVGRNSIDADTGQVPPETGGAARPPLCRRGQGVRDRWRVLVARCELDDGWRVVRVALPAVMSTAERLCEPAKVDPEGRAAVPQERIHRLSAGDLGPGPFGEAGSPTSVGRVRLMEVERRRSPPWRHRRGAGVARPSRCSRNGGRSDPRGRRAHAEGERRSPSGPRLGLAEVRAGPDPSWPS